MAAPGKEYTKQSLDAEIPSVDKLPGRSVVMRHVVDQLSEGELYRFYVQAVNAKGRSSRSPVMSAIAGSVPGMDESANATYSTVRVKNIDVEQPRRRMLEPADL